MIKGLHISTLVYLYLKPVASATDMKSGQRISIILMLKVEVKATKNHALFHTSAIFSAKDSDFGN